MSSNLHMSANFSHLKQGHKRELSCERSADRISQLIDSGQVQLNTFGLNEEMTQQDILKGGTGRPDEMLSSSRRSQKSANFNSCLSHRNNKKSALEDKATIQSPGKQYRGSNNATRKKSQHLQNMQQQTVIQMMQPRSGLIIKTQSKFVVSNPMLGAGAPGGRNRSEQR